jgi:hypothetical protein
LETGFFPVCDAISVAGKLIKAGAIAPQIRNRKRFILMRNEKALLCVPCKRFSKITPIDSQFES